MTFPACFLAKWMCGVLSVSNLMYSPPHPELWPCKLNFTRVLWLQPQTQVTISFWQSEGKTRSRQKARVSRALYYPESQSPQSLPFPTDACDACEWIPIVVQSIDILWSLDCIPHVDSPSLLPLPSCHCSSQISELVSVYKAFKGHRVEELIG